jgi:hypothetical protein
MLLALTSIATFVLAQTFLPAQSIHQELKRRRTDYETREPKSPAALAAIAQSAIEGNLRSKTVDGRLEAWRFAVRASDGIV